MTQPTYPHTAFIAVEPIWPVDGRMGGEPLDPGAHRVLVIGHDDMDAHVFAYEGDALSTDKTLWSGVLHETEEAAKAALGENP